jgi:dUTP pyrophosphatase
MNAQSTVIVRNESGQALPEYATALSAGLDIRAHLSQAIVMEPGAFQLIPTGLFVALPEGTELQVRPRSGLAFKHGITVLNSPGTIDADYRGEIGVLLINHGSKAFTVENGERVAQLILARYQRVVWEEADDLPETKRGAGGFGSTGKV